MIEGKNTPPQIRRWLGWPLLMVLSFILIGCAKEPAEPKMLAHTAHEVIVPLYATLDAEAIKLVKQSAAFCQAMTEQSQQQLQQQWRAAMAAWAAVQPISFGPIEDRNLRWKLQFWPDRKNLTRKKIEAMIAGDDDLSAERVAKASVSVQGLVALEYMLFDERAAALVAYHSDEQAARRCQLLQAIAERIQQVTHQLLVEWQGDANKPGYAGKLSQPGEDNALYPDNNLAIAEVLNTLVVASEMVKRNKLGIPIGSGKGIEHAKPYQLEAWRSQYSLELMRASVGTLEQLYRGNGGYGLEIYLAEDTQVDRSLLKDIDESFKAVNVQFLQLEGPLFTQLKQPEYHAKLTELYRRLNVLESNLSKLPASLGIKLGFNSNDGD